MLEIGQIIDGKYKILNVIGKGGMSVVYLAMNERANKQWAIKEVRKDGTQDFNVVRQGLVAEIDMLKRFNHPNLPSIVDVIDGNGSFLIVMDYIEGIALDKKLQEEGALPQSSVIEWSKQLCDVLGYLHSRKPPIIYRDMKPANVMLKPDNTITLIDFGTAREFKLSSVEDTTVLGTRGYAAPEQYGGQGQTDPRTDIYCLGATMYHLVTGYNPAVPPYEMVPIRQINELLSSGLEAIILKCTRPNPPDRYQSCAELMYALEHYQELDAESQHIQNVKWRSFIAAASLAVVTLIGGVGFNIAKNIQTNSSYESYVSLAKRQESDQAYETFRKAIKLAPEKYKAYAEFLEYIDDDNDINEVEYNMFQQNTLDKIGELEKEDPVMYSLFCYNFSRELFLNGSMPSAEQQSLTYFKDIDYKTIVSAGEMTGVESPEKMPQKAKILSSLADFNNKVDSAKSDEVNYKDNWNTYIDLFNNYDINTTEVPKVAIAIYNKFLMDIDENTSAYLVAVGNDNQQILNQLKYVGEQLENLKPLISGNATQEVKIASAESLIETIKFRLNNENQNAEGGTVQ